MAIFSPTPITALPDVPQLSDLSTFSTKTDSFINALPTFRSENNSLASNVYNNALEAQAFATSASNSSSTAVAQASTATAQASAAATSASTASTQATNATNTYNTFSTQYLGSKSSAPTLNNQGGALITGALYFDTTLNNMRIYNGSSWVTAAGTVSATMSINRQLITATASQTVFNLSFSYSTGTNTIMVYKNGIRLLSSDYTETNSTTITLAVACSVNDELLFEAGITSTGSTLAASNVTYSPGAPLTSTNVQAAIAEVQSNVSAITVPGLGSTTTASGNVQLTTGGIQIVSPTTFGQNITLPDARTLTVGINTVQISNNSNYTVRVLDYAGAVLGFLEGGSSASMNLINKSTAAGSWTTDGLSPVGLTATWSGFNAGIPINVATNNGKNLTYVPISAQKGIFLFCTGSKLYGIVYDASTQTWGTLTVLKASGAVFILNPTLLVSTSNILVVTTDNTTNLDALIVTVSGTTPTANTPATTVSMGATFSATLDAILINGSVVISYATVSANECRAISISGTTCSIGSILTLQGTNPGVSHIYALSSTVAVVLSMTNSTAVYAMPITVSGNTLTPGTGTSVAASNTQLFRSFSISNGARICIVYGNTNYYASIISLSGTTASASTAANFIGAGYNPLSTDIIVNGNYALVLGYQNAVCIIDTNGTISVGNSLTLPTPSISPYVVNRWASNIVTCVSGSTQFYNIDMSNPSSIFFPANQYNPSNGITSIPNTGYPWNYLKNNLRNSQLLGYSNYVYFLNQGSPYKGYSISKNSIQLMDTSIMPTGSTTYIQGSNLNEMFGSFSSGSYLVLQKVECV